MRKTAKKILSIVLSTLMIAGSSARFSPQPDESAFTPIANAEKKELTGKCGENVTWAFDEVSGKLTIDGVGEMVVFGDIGCISQSWPDFYKDIKYVEICEGITYIPDGMFFGLEQLVSVKLPSTLTEIGDVAFGRTALSSLLIPQGVKKIGGSILLDTPYSHNEKNTEDGILYCGKYALDSDENISGKHEIRSGTTVIAKGAFQYRENLTEIIIPVGVEYIPVEAFMSCSALTSVSLPESLKAIDGDAFAWCKSLKNISFPDSVERIGSSVLSFSAYYEDEENWTDGLLYCGNHIVSSDDTVSGSITVRDGIKTIAAYSFDENEKITNLVLPESLVGIGEGAFCRCLNLASVSFPSNMLSIGGSAFSECKLTSVTIPNGIQKIAFECFSGCDELATVDLPETLTEIETRAFSDCKNLSLTIPEKISHIAGGAFAGYEGGVKSVTVVPQNSFFCSDNGILFNKQKTEIIYYPGLKTEEAYSIPSSVTRIGSECFYYCMNLADVSIPNSVKELGARCFAGCENMTNVIIPDSVTLIENQAFWNCDSLMKIHVPDSVEKIGAGAFAGCANLMNIILPNKIKEIDWCTFSECYKLSSVNIPDTVKTIGYEAFSGCKGLTQLKIPNSVVEIGDSAFSGCSGLTSVVLSNNMISIAWGTFWDCTGLTSVIIPDGVNDLGGNAFSGCTGLTSITIPESVTSIKKDTFTNCEKIMIRGYHSSYAEQYAKENGIPFEIISKPIIEPPTEEPKPDEPTTPKIDAIVGTKTVTVGGTTVLAAVGGVKAVDVRIAAHGAKLLDRYGNAVNDDMPLATGMKLVFDSAIFEIAVLGDVDGDGAISVADARLALRQAVNLEKLNGVYLFAGKVGGENVGVSEARKILRAAVGLDDASEWLK